MKHVDGTAVLRDFRVSSLRENGIFDIDETSMIEGHYFNTIGPIRIILAVPGVSFL